MMGRFQQKLFRLADFPMATRRLLIRPLRAEDAEVAFASFDNDPEVSRYVLPAGSLKLRADRYGKIISGYPQENFGYFAINVLGDDTIAGWVGLCPMKDHPHIELLYGVGRKHWGQGYATEAAGAMLRYAFKRMNLPEVVAVVNPANVASKKVVEKLGMTLRGHIKWPKQGVVELFGIDQQAFSALAAGA